MAFGERERNPPWKASPPQRVDNLNLEGRKMPDLATIEPIDAMRSVR